MGTYLNPGADGLRRSRKSRIYVDKSGLIGYLNSVVDTRQCYVCVSRPRRFGKTMAAEMVCAYYDRTVDGALAFAGLKIADDPDFDETRNRYDVLHINMQDFLSATHDAQKLVDRLNLRLSRELVREYDGIDFIDQNNLADVMEDVCSQVGRRFVIVIDEWDCPMRELQNNKDAQRLYLDFMRTWLKDRPYVALAYMTGILPVKKYGTHSALNMFDEFSMLGAEQLATYVGFTEDEVRTFCEEHGRDFESFRAWYDGYRVPGAEGSVVETYNPRAVVRALDTGNFRNYWNETETFEALRRYIDMDMDGLHGKVVQLVAGDRVPVNPATYQNDMTTLGSADDVLTLLVHLGYLTFLPDAEGSSGVAFVPNREVMDEFTASMKASSGNWREVARSIEGSEALLGALVSGRADEVAAGVQRAHEDAASIIEYNDENSLACTLRLAFFSAIRRWRLIREAPAGEGFADFTLVPLASAPTGTPGVVIELKFDDTPEAALAQIRRRGYDRALDGLVAAGGELLLCGIGYSKKDKQHRCLIERG